MQSEMKAPSRREANKQERRQAILTVARRSFLENGYAATSMSGIASELGGSKSTLWSYYPSKEDLFAAVLDDATGAFRAALQDVLAPEGDFAETIHAFCRSFIEKITRDDALRLHRLVAAETTRFPEVGRIFASRGPEPTQQLLAGYLTAQIATGHMRDEDPVRAAGTLVSLCTGRIHHRLLWGTVTLQHGDVEAEADYAARVFLRAFAPQ
ncbi:TetR/AcrR family transcriptional regulator [Sphingomonas sp. HF-S3]|uniref:TetR/AcrR family transcriptional regulator n=2 Tax=Sphingomonas rustica TaxID=3103142 RepID=A0ABV0BEG9_9SPHN